MAKGDIYRIPKGPEGECFSNARQYAADNDGLVVHGTAVNKEGRVLDHAWVEDGNMVADPTIGIITDIETYNERFDAKPDRKYTAKQALMNMIKAGTPGPWTDEEVSDRFVRENPHQAGGRSMAREDSIQRSLRLVSEEVLEAVEILNDAWRSIENIDHGTLGDTEMAQDAHDMHTILARPRRLDLVGLSILAKDILDDE